MFLGLNATRRPRARNARRASGHRTSRHGRSCHDHEMAGVRGRAGGAACRPSSPRAASNSSCSGAGAPRAGHTRGQAIRNRRTADEDAAPGARPHRRSVSGNRHSRKGASDGNGEAGRAQGPWPGSAHSGAGRVRRRYSVLIQADGAAWAGRSRSRQSAPHSAGSYPRSVGMPSRKPGWRRTSSAT